MPTTRKFLHLVLAVTFSILGGALMADPQIWLIGIDNPAGPGGANEFSPENSINNAGPGLVTRIAGDPLYSAASNPAADDDYYFSGTYPIGFNGLTSVLTVPNNEPFTAWEHSLTPGDRTNRFHFILNSSQISAGSMIRLSFDLYTGGKIVSGVNQGFGEHDILVRFKNASGAGSQLYASTITTITNILIIIPTANVAASAGPNTIEIIRTGPNTSGISYYTSFDYVRLEVDAGGNANPVPAAVATQTIPEMAAFTMNLSTADLDTPNAEMLYERISGPTGLTVSSSGVVSWTPGEDQGPSTSAVSVRVTDAGIPRKSATNNFNIVVTEVNRPPTTTAVSTQTINELTPYAVTVLSADPDLPANNRTFSKLSGPDGLTVSTSGQVAWTPSEGQGPVTATVSVRVADDGIPPLFATNNFTVIVREVNTPPIPTVFPQQNLDEEVPFTLNLASTDGDLPLQTLTHTRLSGPTGLVVSTGGLVTWTPTEAQGPLTTNVVVRITDNGSPALMSTNVISLNVREVNLAPTFAAVPIQYVDEISSLDLNLIATDPDVPANALTFFRVDGPTGLTVSSQGRVLWTPLPSQIPQTNTVTVRVDDNGTPPQSDTLNFTVVTRTATPRYLWQIGLDTTPPSMGELGAPNGLNDPAPGKVTRIAGDPQYNAATNPTPDDDFYFSGIYRAGFNNLASLITVPNDEPATAWEFSLTHGDRTNRMHFLLSQSQLVSASRLRLSFEFAYGGHILGGTNLGFQTHDVVVRFRNGNGVATDIYATTLTQASNITFLINPTAVQATLGANSIEFVRTGPIVSGYTYYLHFDYVRLEADPSGNLAPLPVAVSTQTIDELVPYTRTLQTTDGDVPAQSFTYERISGPTGLLVSPGGVVTWTPSETQGPSTNVISVRVTDSGSPPKSATNTFTVVVREVNSSPVPVVLATQNIGEMAAWSLTLQSNDSDVPVNLLTYEKLSGPANLNVSSAGAITWTPTESDGPANYPLSVRVTDNGDPALSATHSFTVIVGEVNRPPILSALATQSITENVTLSFQVPGSDPDQPANNLTYALVSGPPNLSVSPSGALSWTPTEAQGPASYSVAVSITDNGQPFLSTTNAYTISVLESNSPPVWNAITDQTVAELTALNVNLSASDLDIPTTVIVYSLVSGPNGMSVAPGGLLTWTPSEIQGPSTNVVLVRATDSGSPALSATNTFTVKVLEGNSAPTSPAIPETAFDELTALSLSVIGEDTDVPTNHLVFERIDGPSGLTVTAEGAVQWTPTELQGPSTNVVRVRVQDNGDPAHSTTNTFSLVVREVNKAPVMDPIAEQAADQLTPLSLFLSANDADIPANSLTFGLVSGPVGLTVSPAGHVEWLPLPAYNDSSNIVLVRVTDNGTPQRSATNEFTVVVANPDTRLVFAIGVNDDPLVLPYDPEAELGNTNGTVDLAPGGVTRLESDPEYNAESNPTADDHYYFSGVYPSGYNGNTATLTVPEDEPFSAWERELTTADPSNRFHFILNSAQIGLSSRLLLTVGLVSGGFSLEGVPQEGFGSHEVLIRFHNGLGASTDIHSATVTEDSELVVDFAVTDVAATLGANSIEILRTGPSAVGTLHRIGFDFVHLESTAPANTPPLLGSLPETILDELTPMVLNLSSLDGETPAAQLLYSKISGPGGLQVSPSGQVTWTPGEADGPSSYVFAIRVTDDGVPSLSATNEFAVTVHEVNTAPTLSSLPTQSIDEGSLLNVSLTANDSDLPANGLLFEMISGPNGATVDANGLMLWQTDETTGPVTDVIVVRVTDDGTPSLKTTNSFTINIREINQAPVFDAIAAQTVNEMTLLALTLTGADPDIPANALTFALVSGPAGMVVTPGGSLTWTPSESQGPSNHIVRVSLTDAGTPIRSVTNQFTVSVLEENRPPQMASVATQNISGTSTLNLNLSATDPDLPANALTFSPVQVPPGLTVSPGGAVSWAPGSAQIPSVNVVKVRVTDNGEPTLRHTNQFTVNVTGTAPRSIWQIGISNNTFSDFGQENSLNDIPPGKVTRLAVGDTQYNASNNPGPDDDWYAAGNYPIGFNQLTTSLAVPNDEPFTSYERALTSSDRTNRIHFVLTSEQVSANSMFRLSSRFHSAGTVLGGFGTHDIVIRFKNGSGAATQIYANQVTAATDVALQFTLSSVGASAGPNTIEIVRNGVIISGNSQWLNCDYVRLEVDAGGNLPPAFPNLDPIEVNEGTTIAIDLSARDSDTPTAELVHTLLSGPAGATLTSGGQLSWVTTETHGGTTSLVRVRVTDKGIPALSTTNDFSVVVREVNRSPVIAAVSSFRIDPLTPLSLQLGGSDPDLPADGLFYDKVSGPDDLIVTASGQVLWTPAGTDIPSTNTVTVRITDDGSPALSATTQFTVIAQASVDRNVWLIGVDDSPLSNPYLPVDEFGTPTSNSANDAPPGKVTRLAADPQFVSPTPTRDDDYYFAGIYPAGFNGLTNFLTVPFDEPTTSWEAVLTHADRTNRMHFRLSGDQINDTGHLRLSFEFSSVTATTNGVTIVGAFPHTIVVQFKSGLGQSTLLYSNVLTQPTRETIEIPASSIAATLGANTIEFIRTGPTYPSTTQTVFFDYVRLDADVEGNLDADGDGLPRNWEIDNHLSDSDPADAALDLDQDGLTALQEYHGGVNSSNPRKRDTDEDGLTDDEELTAGSNPLVADTDRDGVSDGDEVHETPVTSPLLADSDNDGISDLVERRYGSDPNNAAKKPTRFRGGIGINFVSSYDLLGILGTNGLAGVVPQTLWNETVPMTIGTKPTGGKADIFTPLPGQIVRSDGTNLPNLVVQWNSRSSFATHNHGTGDQVLMNGYIRGESGVPVVLSVTNVPFAAYDVYVYVGAPSDARRGSVRLNNDPATDRFFQARTTAPQAEWIEIVPDAEQTRIGNYVRYENLTSPNFTVSVSTLNGLSVALHAIQIIDRNLDSDVSGIPDWWELRYGLQPATTALAAVDSDGDGLTNLQEFQRGSDPRDSDTDNDGLADGQESSANALRWDSDNDGTSDKQEATALFPTNPNATDSDGDGVSDWSEGYYNSDPTYNEANSPSFTGWTPKYKASPASWEWNLENLQIVWDHGAGAMYPDQSNDNELIRFTVRNTVGFDARSIMMDLRYYKGLLSYAFYTFQGSGFSAPSIPGIGITDAPIGGRVQDLTPLLGFSGFGSADVSDRLQLRMLATRGAANSWTLTFELRNQTRNTLVVTRTFLNCTAAPTVDAGTAQWRNAAGVVGRATMEVHAGAQLFISPTPVENRPRFATTRDTDDDGIPDVWETAHGMNYQSAADALKDLDDDGLNSRDEYFAGTDPVRPDSDGDGISDGVERANGSNPAEVTSVPQYTQFPAIAGEDLNGDGLPDAWQIHFHGFGLTTNGDPDGDGQSNSQEALWGTNPFDSNSKIALSLEVVNSNIKLSWPHQDFKKQTLLWKTGEDPWVAFAGQPWSDGGISWLVLSNRLELAPTEMYRVDTMDRDSDGDGVTDWAENILGTDPHRNNSSRSPVRIVAADGTVTGSIAGDYASFVDQVRTGSPFGAHQMSRLQAARFLQQAAFGPTPAELDRVQEMGFAAWIDDQIANQPMTLHLPYIREIVDDFFGPRVKTDYMSNTDINVMNANNITTSFARAAVQGPDQLRQRVAFALSQILVVSRRAVDIQESPMANAVYYDIFVRNAFGNYFDTLREVTLNPAMGMYLSAIGNQKAIPEINQYPDENYAREVQQLFSIGLWELNQDGSQVLDPLGKPILTYGNREITEFARVFTGFWFGGQTWGVGGFQGNNDNDSVVPMDLWIDKHDFGEKTLLRGFKIPARSPSVQNGLKDVDDALMNLVDHPNTGPFIGKQLIQFLVTSNPSSNYISRISAVFANDGNGVRANLGAVVKAILLDPEARDPQWSATNEEYGRLKEPVYRAMNLARVGNLARHPNLLWWSYHEFNAAGLQEPMLAPTVFNFFRPNYQPPGIMAVRNLVGPVFQITDSYTSIAFPNKLWEITEKGFTTSRYSFIPDYTELMAIADDAEALLDEVNLLICGGGMSASTRRNLLEALEQVAPYDRILRAQLAVYLAVSCPDGAVQR